jgi:predicted hydrocarbon binding protein
VPLEETVAVFRLVGRRPDSALVFADAGRRAARYAARGAPFAVRVLLGSTPAFVRRRVGAGAAARAAQRIFAASLVVRGRSAEAVIVQPLSMRATTDGRACSFYGAALAELLRTLTGFEGAMVHARCRGRGDNSCRWQAAAAEGYA